MSPSENAQLAQLKDELLTVYEQGQQALVTQIEQTRTDFKPALDFYQDIAAVGKFMKWGLGIGASLAGIGGGIAALHIAGIL